MSLTSISSLANRLLLLLSGGELIMAMDSGPRSDDYVLCSSSIESDLVGEPTFFAKRNHGR